MKVFITGGAGFIGSNLIKYLTDLGYVVDYCDNSFSSNENTLIKNATKIVSDISELSKDILGNYDTLIHLAAVKKHNILGCDDLDSLYKTNIIDTVNLFKNAGDAGVKNIIFSSSLYANGNMRKLLASEDDIPCPLTLYGQSKLFGEFALKEVVQKYSINATALRLYFIYGPNQYTGKGYPSVFLKTFDKLRGKLPPIIVNDGLQRLDYLYIDDLCSLIHKVMHSPLSGFNIFNASSENAYTIRYVIEVINRAWASRFGASVEPIYCGMDFTAETFRSGSCALAKSTFQWNPSISLDDGVNNMLDWYLSES